jgi:hypothetical protein
VTLPSLLTDNLTTIQFTKLRRALLQKVEDKSNLSFIQSLEKVTPPNRSKERKDKKTQKAMVG